MKPSSLGRLLICAALASSSPAALSTELVDGQELSTSHFSKPSDGVTIVSISRHTFRGISKSIGPQHIALPEYGIQIKIPLLSYGENATPEGLKIAKEYGSRGLREAANTAVEALGESKSFDDHLEIITDLGSERTFWTALQLRRGSQSTAAELPVKGCKTSQGTGVDAITSADPVMKCIPPELTKSLLAASPDLDKYKARSKEFLDTIRSSIGANQASEPLPDPVYTEGKFPKAYEQIGDLASALEMSAILGPPLPLIFKDAPQGPLLEKGNAALTAALNMIGIHLAIKSPPAISDALSVNPLRFMMSQTKGSHTALVSHDDFIFSLIRSLGLISTDGPPDDLAIYPIETFVFAFGERSVSVVRMRIPDQLRWLHSGAFWEIRFSGKAPGSNGTQKFRPSTRGRRLGTMDLRGTSV